MANIRQPPDLTEINRLERELRATGAKYRRMVEQGWDGIVIHDNQCLLFANRSFRCMFGLDPAESLEGIQLHGFLAPETRRSLFKALKEAKTSTDRPVIFEGSGIRPDGDYLDLELSTFATTYQERPAMQTVIRDITKRKNIEERLLVSERLAATCKLAFNLAHELNNPIGGIITYSHLLKEDLAEGADRAQLEETLNRILKLGNRCKIIVGALLDFARDDENLTETVHLHGILSETLSLLKGHAVMNGLSVEQELDPDLPPIHGDRSKMEQVFMNLIINAAEALNGRGRLVVSTQWNPGLREVCIRFSDDGPGIDDETRQRIFEPFYTTKERGRGTGLGLSISHGIIKRHKGRMEVESPPGQGTTFAIHLPCLIPQESRG